MKICPHCGAELKDKATFCKECGSDTETGWKEGAEFVDLETPDYDEIVENEFGKRNRWSSKIASLFVVGILLFPFVLAFIF